MTETKISPVGIIRSPYKEKFAIPRQPSLAPAGTGELHLLAPYNNPEMVKGLEQFSHLWLIFLFHQTTAQGWHPTVRPPRLGGNERIGVFASRSTFRPNNLGLSAVELKGIHIEKENIILQLGSVDLLDGTPIIDIKPYIPYADSYPDALAGYAQLAPENDKLQVSFSEVFMQQIQQYQNAYPQLQPLIEQVIQQDPRPAYKHKNTDLQQYGMQLFDFNIRWQVQGQLATVIDLEKLNKRR
ncbi:tRNA (N6-threonylcarbamoyladenosine(37)-N6)-methyltransferase TrmO [Zophobihabitans entericus]|uniref:tRNA (N6-threonylcarbamoyladenosine(37)-N6)-methyltransferase TrmO n=1 Tax=Zophobihabitans entericus TaxID=1635327 RepID=A0A6G9IAP7_9GAMM|nr:tRNA (N6-threonylcarbamoyladenosine(37)-N6)-methyltransferase TrmO [Zophobihabitans entericus]QIQ20650.1 tRNA (N6-threonylcarbamoyladenosine(37)-N6)-methyltransferase TrmO [Zophobihabitans entericus]